MTNNSAFFTPVLLSLLLTPAAQGQSLSVPYSASPVIIDGLNNEAQWQQSKWQPIDQLMDGSMPSKQDFSGRYRLLWDEQALYLQAEIQDDVLYDGYPDPVTFYWSDDCLEIFVDEDRSGGDHQYNHNAFAYHVALDNQSVDLDVDKTAVLLNDHVLSRWQRQADKPYNIIWEAAIKLYPDTFTVAKPGKPVTLHDGKKVGFMLAYCDNDGSEVREHFVGSHKVTPVDGSRNRGWIDASVFGEIILVRD